MENSDNNSNGSTLVLVTGANGFIAAWVVYQLMLKGYKVRGTMRGINNKKKTSHLITLPKAKDNLELVELDMLESSQEEFNKAVNGCDYVIHVASPVVVGGLKANEYDRMVIRPAVEGTLKLFKACTNAGTVKRVVFTTSMVAFSAYFGGDDAGFDPKQPRTVHPTEWTDLSRKVTSAYTRSKTLAEKVAWDYVRENKCTFDMVSIGPSLVLGPILNAGHTPGNKSLAFCMNKNIPFMVDLGVWMLDVRDCAECHIRAMEIPEAGGQRFLVGAARISAVDLMKMAGNLYNSMGYKFPSKIMPGFIYKLAGLFDPESATGAKLLGNKVDLDVETSITVLGIKYRSFEDTIIATCDSLVYHKLAPKTKMYQQRWHLPNEETKEESTVKGVPMITEEKPVRVGCCG